MYALKENIWVNIYANKIFWENIYANKNFGRIFLQTKVCWKNVRAKRNFLGNVHAKIALGKEIKGLNLSRGKLSHQDIIYCPVYTSKRHIKIVLLHAK